MARDFSDAGNYDSIKVTSILFRYSYIKQVLMAELVAHFNPKIVDLHNYIATGSIQQKVANWKIINGSFKNN